MSKSKSTISTPKTPKRRRCTDPVEVSCRLRPLLSTDNGTKCIERITDTTLKITAPAGSQGYRNNPSGSLFYSFNSIFPEEDGQKSVFDKLALPLVDDLVKGKNGLLFAYGVTCSGKTHTMIGQANNPGILPRCLDVVFNTIGENQCKPYIFLPDDTNGMKIQPEYQAALMKNQMERQKRQEERLRKKEGKLGSPDLKADEIRIPDSTKLDSVNEDSVYAMFISYVEVYNNYIFDLLEEDVVDQFGQPVLPESKKVGEDTKRRVMYVKDIVEVEVKSTEEACTQVWKGQDRRRKAATILNDKSSRSHSVFNIRLVQAPYDEEGKQILLNKDSITISQLSLVDLAGSERPSRTNATGGALKEAGNINSSLMTLQQCLETLRANQISGRANKMVPYRESKLTLLFKNYFEGEGRVRMVVCVNPRIEDYDETVHVMKFAEMTQDVKVTRGHEVQFDENVLQPGRRKQNLLYKRVSQGGEPLADITNRNSFGFNLPSVPPAFALPPFPTWAKQDGTSEDKYQAVLAALHERQKMKKDALEDFEKRKQRMRAVLVQMEKENEELLAKTSQGTTELTLMNQEIHELRSSNAKLERENLKQKREIDKLKKQNSLYLLESRRVIEEKQKTEEKIRKEVAKRENMRKTFKGVVGREKEKWEKTTERLIRHAELGRAHQDAKLRQVLKIVGGNPELVPETAAIDVPQFSDVNFPSSTKSSSSDDIPTTDSADSLPPTYDKYDYRLPFKDTKRILENRKGMLLSPASSCPKSDISYHLAGKPVGGIKVLPTNVPSPTLRSTKDINPQSPSLTSSRAVPSRQLSPSRDISPSRLISPTKNNPTPRSKVPTPAPSLLSNPPPTISPDKPTSVISKPRRTGRSKAKSPHNTAPSPITTITGPVPTECHIEVDDRPDIPIKARIPKNLDGGCIWLNHKPAQNFEEENILKPTLDKKKTVPIPDVDDFDDKTNKYLLHHQEQDSLGEIRTHFIKGDIKVSRGGGRCVEFTDIETSSKKPSAKAALGDKAGIYPPPTVDSGDWTDTETRCAVGVGIPTAKTTMGVPHFSR